MCATSRGMRTGRSWRSRARERAGRYARIAPAAFGVVIRMTKFEPVQQESQAERPRTQTGANTPRSRGHGPVVMLAMAGVMVFLVACAGSVKLTFINETDALLCYSSSRASAEAGGRCQEVRPNATSAFRPGCGNARQTSPVSAVLTLGQTDPLIYEWRDSGATITIGRRGDEFIVTDSLPAATPDP